MANIIHCDKCNSVIRTGFEHHATLRFMNPIKQKGEKEGFVTDSWEADYCGKCLKDLFKTYFNHLGDHLNIKEFDLDF